MIGDATLFSRTDLVETAWRIAQPMLDHWAETPMDDSTSYPAGSWGPKAAFDLIDRGGRHWKEVINRDILSRIPLFKSADAICLHNMAMTLLPEVFKAGETVVKIGEMGEEMFFICRGQVEVVDKDGKQITTLGEGEYFGEMSLLNSKPRNATVRALTPCNLFVLDKDSFNRVAHDHPEFKEAVAKLVEERLHHDDHR
jgi:glucose-6-phosphate 1-dehydrogenase